MRIYSDTQAARCVELRIRIRIMMRFVIRAVIVPSESEWNVNRIILCRIIVLKFTGSFIVNLKFGKYL